MSSQILLAYGRGSVTFSFDDNQFSLLGVRRPGAALELDNGDRCQSGARPPLSKEDREPLSDFDVGTALDSPIASPTIDEVAGSDDSVLIVVSDATRATASAQVVNLLVRRLVQTGVSPARIAVIFATGIHRRVSEREQLELLTPFVVQRLRILAHDAYDDSRLTTLGTTQSGVKVEVNSALKEFTRVFLTGGVGFHYFAGFTGGRKSICPGLASAATIEATHMLAMDFAAGGRKTGVRAGVLDGNAVHEECERVAALVAPAFSVNVIVDESKRAVKVFCGDWRLAHRAACEYYLERHAVEIPARRDLVIASCGGFPHDINLIQAHKALDMAALACTEGGTIVLLAECSEGLGRSDFLKWFEAGDSRELEKRLARGYEVNGQTAWALLTKAERYRVCLISDLPDDHVRRMRMIPVRTISEALVGAGSGNGFIMPRGAALLPRLSV